MALKSTKHILRHCMIKLIKIKKLEKITVSEICEMAEVEKRTFYRYYSDKYALFEDAYIHEFYSHAIASKGQNGFWELISNLIVPIIVRRLTYDPYIDSAKEFYIKKDIEILLHTIEKWILGGYK